MLYTTLPFLWSSQVWENILISNKLTEKSVHLKYKHLFTHLTNISVAPNVNQAQAGGTVVNKAYEVPTLTESPY